MGRRIMMSKTLLNVVFAWLYAFQSLSNYVYTSYATHQKSFMRPSHSLTIFFFSSRSFFLLFSFTPFLVPFDCIKLKAFTYWIYIYWKITSFFFHFIFSILLSVFLSIQELIRSVHSYIHIQNLFSSTHSLFRAESFLGCKIRVQYTIFLLLLLLWFRCCLSLIGK